MTNRALRLGLMAFAVAALLSLLVWFAAGGHEQLDGAQQGSQSDRNTDQAGEKSGGGNGTLTNLASMCASSVGEDGYGKVTIDHHLTISNETGEIPVPCRMHLERGGWLKLNKVQLRSKYLSVSDYGSNGETRVVVNNSDLLATGRHGFFLQLFDAEDSVAVHHSTFDFPLSVWVRISDQREDAPGGGRIEVTNSTVRSVDPQSEDGIQFVAGELGGEARFSKLRLYTGEPEGEYQNALLFAGECEPQQVEGFPNRCGPEAMLQGLEGNSISP